MPQHLALPIRVTAGGRLATVEQDSPEDISQSVALLIETHPGERRSVPDYGVPDPTFGGVSLDEIVASIAEWEERADPTMAELVATGVLQQADLYPAGPTGDDETEA